VIARPKVRYKVFLAFLGFNIDWIFFSWVEILFLQTVSTRLYKLSAILCYFCV